MTIQIIIQRPDGGCSVITNPPVREKLQILAEPQEIEIVDEPYLVFVEEIEEVVDGEILKKPVYEEKIRKLEKVTKKAIYREETQEEWLDRVINQALETCKASFGEGDYTYEIINT